MSKTSTQSKKQTVAQICKGCKTVSSKIRAMSAAGYSVKEIHKPLSEHLNRFIRYQWVYNVLHTKVANPKK